MADDQEERREIEAYLEQHHLQSFIGDAVNDIVKERPKDPLSQLGDALRACSEASRQIQKVHGRQILNGEALPALEVEIRTGQVRAEHASFLAVVGRYNNNNGFNQHIHNCSLCGQCSDAFAGCHGIKREGRCMQVFRLKKQTSLLIFVTTLHR